MTDAVAMFLQMKFHWPTDVTVNVEMVLRLVHFLAGITWIGLLYFFNLVNVPLMKALDAPTKGKVIPQLMPRALWWFRWSAVVTVLAGFFYFVLILHTEPPEDPGVYTLRTLGIWLVVTGAAFAVEFFLLRQAWVTKNGWTLAAIVTVLALAMAVLLVYYNTYPGASHRGLAIGVGGAYGTFMLLNVWGVIWPAQKRLIAWTAENAEKGTPIPPEAAALARRAFLVSRANAWLSIPMLFFMLSASHFIMFVGG